MNSPKNTEAEIIKALAANGGIASAAAPALGLHPQYLRQLIRENPAFKAVQTDAKESLVDLAESKLIKGVNEGNPTFVIFTLKTLGKDRGYRQGMEVTGREGGPIEVGTVDMSKLSMEALKEIRAASLQVESDVDEQG